MTQGDIQIQFFRTKVSTYSGFDPIWTQLWYHALLPIATGIVLLSFCRKDNLLNWYTDCNCPQYPITQCLSWNRLTRLQFYCKKHWMQVMYAGRHIEMKKNLFFPNLIKIIEAALLLQHKHGGRTFHPPEFGPNWGSTFKHFAYIIWNSSKAICHRNKNYSWERS